MLHIFRIFIGVLIFLTANSAVAAFPERQVKVVVPYPPGGGADTSARLIAAKLTEIWQQPVVIENRPGALGAIGTELVMRAPADGYTLLLHSPIMLSTELNRPTVPYRTLRDFKAVAVAATSSLYFMANNESATGELKPLMASGVASNPLSFGSHGEGASAHYLGLRLTKLTNSQTTHVPFSGDSTILQALLGGHIKTGFLSGPGAKQAQDSGRVRALGTASKVRSPLLPSVPTFTELGLKGMDRDTWSMFLVRNGTPQAIIEQISRDVNRVIRQPDVQKRFAVMGLATKEGEATETQRLLEEDYAYWVNLVEEFGALVK